MIRVFVRKEHAVEPGDIFADGSQAFREFAPANAGIDQDARTVSRQESGVSGTAAGENADFENEKLRDRCIGYTTTRTKRKWIVWSAATSDFLT